MLNRSSYVYTEYCTVNPNDWHWNANITQLEYSYYNEYIDESMIDRSFVLVYFLETSGDEQGVDVPLPAIIYSADGLHSGRIRYDVRKGEVRLIVESIDGDNSALLAMLNNSAMNFKICMMINAE